MRVAVRALLSRRQRRAPRSRCWPSRAGTGVRSTGSVAGWSLVAAAGRAAHVTRRLRMLLGLPGASGSWLPRRSWGSGRPRRGTAGAVWLAPLATALLGRRMPGGPTPLARAAWSGRLGSRASCPGWDWLADRRDGRVPRHRRTPGQRPFCRPGAAGGGCGHGSPCCLRLACSRRLPGRDQYSSRWSHRRRRMSRRHCGVPQARVATDNGFAGSSSSSADGAGSSLERRLARAVGDPRLRLLYQLAPGLPFVTVSGCPPDHARGPGHHCDGPDRSGGGSSRA